MLDVHGSHLVPPAKAAQHLKKADPVLASVIVRAGPCRINYTPPTFETLTRCIVYQQLNGKAAATIFGRLASACGEMSPERVLKLRTDRMRRIGLSKQKAEYVRSLAQKTRSGELQLETISNLGDNEVIHQLTQVKGIGVWTSHMFLMFALGRPDILPTGDYGIGAAMKKLYGLGAMPKPAMMEQIAAPWMPWRTVASWYLWRSLEFKDEA